jgi:hypothetical protein
MGDNVDDLFRLVNKYKPLKVGIEVSGQQGGFIPWIKQQMMQRNCFFNIGKDKVGGKSEEGYRPTTNKVERLKIAIPWIKQGHLYLPKELENDPRIEEAVEELELASPSGFRSLHDDWIDTLSMITRLNAVKPSNRVILSSGSRDSDDSSLIPDKYRSINIWELDKEDENDESVGFGKYMV